MGFPGVSLSKESAFSAGDPGSIPGWENPLRKEMAKHSSTLAWKIPWTEEAGWAAVHGVSELGKTEQLTNSLSMWASGNEMRLFPTLEILGRV